MRSTDATMRASPACACVCVSCGLLMFETRKLRAFTSFCMRPNVRARASAAAHGVQAVSLETLLAQSKIVSLHLVPSPATRGLLNAERLATMRDDAILVNSSRSALINHQALCAALQRGRPAFAALDVFDVEPLPADDPLRALPNALLTPHLGFVTEPVFARFAQGVVEGLLAWLRAEKPPRMLS